MHIDEILKLADFSKETNFKERLSNKLNIIFSDDELDDDQAANVIAASGEFVNLLPAHHHKVGVRR